MKYLKTHEGFFDFFKKKVNKKSIDYNQINDLVNDSFLELIDNGYTVKNGHMGYPYIQITKHPYINGRLFKKKDIPYKFTDVKSDVLSFYDRMKSHGVDINFAYVYENDKGGLSIDKPTYQELESGLYDNRDVSILTLEMTGIDGSLYVYHDDYYKKRLENQ